MPTTPHICLKCNKTFYEWAYRNYKRCPECRNPAPPISKKQLEEMYIKRKMSIDKISKSTDATKRTVQYWMKKFGIQPRTAIKTRFPNRPEPPTKEILYNLYWMRYLSCDDIASLYQVDRTAILYWLRKNEIPRRSIWETRRKGKTPKEPTREEIEILYCNHNFSTKEIGEMFGVSAHVVSIRMKKYGIKPRLPGYNQIRYTGKDGHELLSGLEMRVDDWLFEHDIKHVYEPPLPFRGKADFLVKDIYIEVWGVSHNAAYSDRVKEKVRLYKKNGLKLIGLYPKDVFRNLDNKLSVLTTAR